MTFQNAFASPAGWAKARATARRIKIREQVAKEKAKAKTKTKAPPKRQQSKPKSMTEISRLLKNPKPLSRPDAVHKKYANILK